MMGAMRRNHEGLRGPAVSLGLAMLSALVGCDSETVCIDQSNSTSSCPSRQEAERLIQCAGGNVMSIDSEAELDEGACCYDATKSDEYLVSYDDCTTGTGTGTGTTCDGCATAASTGDPSNLCSESFEIYDALARCLCIESCAFECNDNSCSGIPADSTCLNCADTFCAVELDDCARDF